MRDKLPKKIVIAALERAGAMKEAAANLGLPERTLRDLCSRYGVDPSGRSVIPDRAFRFKAGNYHNKCSEPGCYGAPLPGRDNVCITCYIKSKRETTNA